jgi:hypothetical protein
LSYFPIKEFEVPKGFNVRDIHVLLDFVSSILKEPNYKNRYHVPLWFVRILIEINKNLIVAVFKRGKDYLGICPGIFSQVTSKVDSLENLKEIYNHFVGSTHCLIRLEEENKKLYRYFCKSPINMLLIELDNREDTLKTKISILEMENWCNDYNLACVASAKGEAEETGIYEKSMKEYKKFRGYMRDLKRYETSIRVNKEKIEDYKKQLEDL